MKQSLNTQFTPEQEILLWAIRVDHAKDQQVAGILASGVDWCYIRETAIRHGIIPLLYKRLKKEMKEFVPADELSSLKKLFMTNTINNLRMTQHLLKTLDLLEDSGIKAMPFKGPVLAVQAYGDLSMRSFGDLDILIHASDFSSAYKILKSKDFLPQYAVDSKIKTKLLINLEKELTFFYQNIVFEIHWNILEKILSISFDQDKIWSRTIPVFTLEKEVRTLSPEDTVIILCIHGTKHVWSNLIWIADLAYLISNHPEIVWRDIFDRAEKMGVQRIVFLGLFLAKVHSGLRYLPYIENRFESDKKLQPLADSVSAKFFKNSKKWWLFYTPPLFYLKSRERWRDRLTFIRNSLKNIILEYIIPDIPDFKIISLPDSLFFLYVIIRPSRILRDYCLRRIRSKLQKNEDNRYKGS